MNILVIEDNEQNIYLVRYLLRACGHRISEARDGHEGVAMAKAEAPDLILLDIQLPQMDGYEVARALRKDPALDAVPIVAVTSYAMDGDREKVLEAGCDAYIEKPINPDVFATEVAAAAAAGRRKPGGVS